MNVPKIDNQSPFGLIIYFENDGSQTIVVDMGEQYAGQTQIWVNGFLTKDWGK